MFYLFLRNSVIGSCVVLGIFLDFFEFLSIFSYFCVFYFLFDSCFFFCLYDWYNCKEGGVFVNKLMLVGIGIGVVVVLGVVVVVSLNVFEWGL